MPDVSQMSDSELMNIVGNAKASDVLAAMNSSTPPAGATFGTQADVSPNAMHIDIRPNMKPDLSKVPDSELMDFIGKQQQGAQNPTPTPEENLKPIDRARTMANQAFQGMTFGAGDEGQALLAAAIAKNFGGEATKDVPFQDLYNEALGSSNKEIRQENVDYPGTSVASNIAGGIMGGGAIAKGVGTVAPELSAAMTSSPTKIGAITKSAGIGATAGATMGAMSADPTIGESRVQGAETGVEYGAPLGAVGGAISGKLKPEPLPTSLKEGLIEGTPDARTHIGEELGTGILNKAEAAHNAKEAAYAKAGEAGKTTTAAPEFAQRFADHIDQSLDGLDPVLVPAVNRIKSYTQELRDLAGKEGVTGVKYNVFETLRQRLNKIPFNRENSQAIQSSKRAFDDVMNSILDKGILEGDENAISLIKDARAKNTYYMQKFGGKEANKIIKKYVQTEGESLAPENLTDMFTRVGQAGLDGVTAAKDVLGPNAIPLLKQGYLNKIRNASLDSKGNVDPVKLGKEIFKLTGKNQSLIHQVFTPQEVAGLNAISSTASRIDKDPSLLGKILHNVPMVRHWAEDIQSATRMKQIANPNGGMRYQTIAGKVSGSAK